MIRVLVAEDSVTVRELLVQILSSDPEIQVIGEAKNGMEAVEQAVRLKPDVITMDVHMPELDGLEATKEIMVRSPTPIVVVSSSHSARDVELSLSAMRAGALLVLPKPDDPRSDQFAGRQGNLLTMVKAMSSVKVVRRWTPRTSAPRPPAPSPLGPLGPVRVIAIGASTGGPAALERILKDLPGDFSAPILVVQHIATGFASGLARWLSGSASLRVKIAEPGEMLRPRTVFIAPDDRHLGVGADGRIEVTAGPEVNGLRPSATHLFESVARSFGPGVVAVILTGMGRDGVEGLRAVKIAGGQVIAQDESSSVVYGMPREAVTAGVVDIVASIEDIAPRLRERAGEPEAGRTP
jgi:two-component system chemotaxis response regulator CheB